MELTNSLNHEKGGDLSRRLGELYAYAVDRLTEANVEQKEAPLEEVQRLLMTLIEGWNEVEYQPSGDVAAATAAPEAEPAYAGSSPAGWGGAGRGEGPVTRQSWSV